MSTPRIARGILAALLLAPSPASPQGVVVDQGRFDVRLNGRIVGVEDFTIRRAGLGRDDALFANATIQLALGEGSQQIAPLLRAAPPEGVAIEYQVQVTGPDALELRLRRVGRRFNAVIQSASGEEQREFPADADTRVLEMHVAHHYYFLRDLREGSMAPVLEPRTRERATLVASAPAEVELRTGQAVVQARRVDFTSPSGVRSVWYDRLGRVLRVEIPDRGYVAERTDLMR